MTLLAVTAVLLVVLIGSMQLWRLSDQRAANAAWAELLNGPQRPLEEFDPAMVEGLPEAAQRYFLYAIAPGTPLRPVSEIRMRGEIGLGDQEAPGYQPMRARQILAPPHGLVWRLEAAGSGAMRMSGSDAAVGERSWTRFWLLGTLPVVRAGGNLDHIRSAFGRVVAEAAIWAPASLLAQNGVRWEEGDGPHRAQAVVTHGSLEQRLMRRASARLRRLSSPEPVATCSTMNSVACWRLDIVRLNDRVLDRAGRMKPLELRSLDAIHLATADLVTTGGVAHVVTCDQRMAEAARSRDTLTAAFRRKKERSDELLRAIRYERALAYEALGDLRRARTELEGIYAEAPDYEDVGRRLGAGATAAEAR